MQRILFVCTGNICRSPTTDGVMRQLSQTHNVALTIDSAGTHSYHVGESPDPRSIKTAAVHGYDLSGLRARQLTHSDFHRFDMVFGLDKSHMRSINALRPADATAQCALFLDYLGHPSHSEIPDPYYGGQGGFEDVLSLCEWGCTELMNRLKP